MRHKRIYMTNVYQNIKLTIKSEDAKSHQQ